MNHDSIRSPEEISRLVEEYSDLILRISMHYVKNRQDAEDIAQMVFLKVVRSQPYFENAEHEKAWMIRVTINQCRDYLKSSWFRLTAPYIEAPAVQNTAETRDEVLWAIRQLPEKYRNVIYLYYYEQLGVKEIAQILSAKENTVLTWLSRARSKLMPLLKGEFDHVSG